MNRMKHLSVVDNCVELPESMAAVYDIKIRDAQLPKVYEAAKASLEECARIDECQDWANKAEALASYARQSDDDSLFKLATKIQGRAIRRCGELLRQIGNDDGGRPPKNQDGNDLVLTRTQAATQAGLSERQKKTALRLANIPQLEFEALVESESPPTVRQLAERGKVSKPKPLIDLEGIDPKMYPRATQLQGSLKMLAEFCHDYDPVSIAHAFKAHEKEPLRKNLTEINAWTENFLAAL